jgi:hypothetical protein
MEQQDIEQYINKYIEECLNAPSFISLNEEQKNQVKQQLGEYFNQLIIETLINNLSLDQLQLFAAQIPGFLMILEEQVKKSTESIKQTGQIPQELV